MTRIGVGPFFLVSCQKDSCCLAGSILKGMAGLSRLRTFILRQTVAGDTGQFLAIDDKACVSVTLKIICALIFLVRDHSCGG